MSMLLRDDFFGHVPSQMGGRPVSLRNRTGLNTFLEAYCQLYRASHILEGPVRFPELAGDLRTPVPVQKLSR